MEVITSVTCRAPAAFVGDDREASTMLACPRCLNCRVQRQQVGLLGDVVDSLHYRSDFLAQLAELLDIGGGLADDSLDLGHRFGGLAHGRATMLGCLAGLLAGTGH